MLNLDTHIVIQFMEQQLSDRNAEILQKEEHYCISPIVFWELAMLSTKNRIQFSFEWKEWVDFSKHLKILPLNQQVAQQSVNLDFKSDPADHMIAATSIVYEVPLVTEDKIIRQSKIVPLA